MNGPLPPRTFAQPRGTEADFLVEFDYDLSLRPERNLDTFVARDHADPEIEG